MATESIPCGLSPRGRETVARKLAQFLKRAEPWYDWGRRDVFRIDMHCRDFADESQSEVWFFEIQWFGLHFGVCLGRTPPKVSDAEISARRAARAARAEDQA